MPVRCYCGFRIRGKNHESGEHHKKAIGDGCKAQGKRKADVGKNQ